MPLTTSGDEKIPPMRIQIGIAAASKNAATNSSNCSGPLDVRLLVCLASSSTGQQPGGESLKLDNFRFNGTAALEV